MASFERIMDIVVAVVAVLLQVFLAPHIAIWPAYPNFAAAACIVLATLHPRSYGCIIPFLLGLAFDVVSGGPVGAMAFSLTAFSVGAAWFFERVNNDTVFMALVALAAGLLLVEVSYAVFVLLLGYDADVLEAFAYRTLPCYAYDLVIAVAFYLVASRLSRGGGAPQQSEITQLQ